MHACNLYSVHILNFTKQTDSIPFKSVHWKVPAAKYFRDLCLTEINYYRFLDFTLCRNILFCGISLGICDTSSDDIPSFPVSYDTSCRLVSSSNKELLFSCKLIEKLIIIVAFDIIAYEDTSFAAHQTSHIVTFFPTCIAKIVCCYDRVVMLSYPGH